MVNTKNKSQKQNMQEIFDLAIIGGGPAGFSSAIYAGRYKLKTVLFTDIVGGNTAMAHKISNYPGFQEISGVELIQKMYEQTEKLNIPIFFEKVIDIENQKDFFVIISDTQKIYAKKIILAVGTKRKELGLPNEKKFVGKGISYCATCDAYFYNDKIVAIVGGGNAALSSAVMLGDIAKKVYLIHRRESFRAEPFWQELVKKNPKIEVFYNCEVKKLLGKDNLEGVILSNGKKLQLDCLFVEIGMTSQTDFLKKLNIMLDEDGYIIVDKQQRTNIPGIFAAGDATNFSELKQILLACAQGALAAYFVYNDLKNNKK
ncbi:MAG TPA: FAD-dependent oxidoreductase [archaeon]|nr:FAD-dependent oxidoreductase [archaeon]HRT02418.1 FAD-dependent oxidoreductase [Candidatus Diapherotrites archaeon]